MVFCGRNTGQLIILLGLFLVLKSTRCCCLGVGNCGDVNAYFVFVPFFLNVETFTTHFINTFLIFV